MNDSEKLDELLRLARANRWLNGWTVDLLVAVTVVLVVLIAVIVYIIWRRRVERGRESAREERDQERWAKHIEITERAFEVAGDYQNMLEKYGSISAKAATSTEKKVDQTHDVVVQIAEKIATDKPPSIEVK
jgi:membrane protein implicated in regulation of membrane protease activity